MISKFRPRAHQRYSSLPVLGPILDEFAEWSTRRGYTFLTVRYKLHDARHLDGLFREFGIQGVSDLTHDSFEAACSHYRRRGLIQICGTINRIKQFLEETGRLAPHCPPATAPTPITAEMDRFVDYLRKVRGFEPSTIGSHARYSKRFLEHLSYDRHADVMASLAGKEVEDFLCICARQFNRYSLQHVVASLRAFLRFQHEQGALPTPLHMRIDTPRIYRLEQLPHSLSWETVNSLLLSIDRTNKTGIRDYAVLFLMATYGLRNCEIIALTLDDIDWRAGVLRIRQKKTRNLLLLPLTDAVAEALIDYLERSRPMVPYRELFLRVHAPNGPLERTAATDIFQYWTRRSGLDIPFQGSHCVRHSYAVHLLRQGVSVKAIGDLLGHRTTESTCIYLRLAVEDLRSVALPVPRKTEAAPNTLGASRLSPRPQKTFAAARRSPSVWRSFLAEDIQSYLRLKRSLGRIYRSEAFSFRSLDAFLAAGYPSSNDLTGEMFTQWCATFRHLSPTVRRNHMRLVRNLCLYRRRSRPQSFLPDLLSFPRNNPPVQPHILSESDMARILEAAGSLHLRSSLLRAETLRMAFLLLCTTGMRRGELVRLKLGDIDASERTLFIRETKFHKSRLIPLSDSVASELKAYLSLRQRNGLPMDMTSPVAWHGFHSKGKRYSDSRLFTIWTDLCVSLNIYTIHGKPPRLHDIRHSFAVNALLRCYRDGEDVQAKLPLLSTYMGHVSVVSTHYYLTFIEGLRSEASVRFYRRFGNVITLNPSEGAPYED